MKISKRDIGLLLLLLGLVAVIFVYNFVYTPNLTKIETEKAALSQLQEQESTLANLKANRKHYEDEIVRMQDEDAQVIAHYPSQILPENDIMYAVELEETKSIYFNALSYGSASLVGMGTEAQTGISGYSIPMNMTYQSTYQGLKDAITHTLEKNDRMIIDTVTATFDNTTGNLTGSLQLMQYILTGTDKQYVEPYVPAMAMGKDNIFGTFELMPADGTPASAADGQ